jgi:hypothetical protein
MSTYAHIGSISSGTLRNEDLIPAFISALEDVWNDLATSAPEGFDATEEAKAQSTRITNLLADVERRMIGEDGETSEDYFESEDSQWDLESLQSMLEEFAPPFCYFGAHEGDGADFGFWLSHDALEDAERDGEIVKVDAGDEWPELGDDAQYVLEVTDHGNITLYTPDRKEVWSLV